MDALETLVRDTLAEHATDAPPPSVLDVERRPRQRTWLYASLAAAAVASVAIGVTVLAQDAGVGDHVAVRPAPATPSPTGFVSPPNTKPISDHGITVDVPQDLRVGSAACQVLPTNMVAVGDPTAVHSCTAMVYPPAGTSVGGTYVSLLSWSRGGRADKPTLTRPTTVNGIPGTIGYKREMFRSGLTGILTLPDPGVVITVAAPARADVDRILYTTRKTSVDSVGCRAQVASLTPTGNAAAASFVPGHPVSAIACGYATQSGETWQYDSHRLSTAKTAGLAELLDNVHRSRGTNGFGTAYHNRSATWVVFRYSDGSTHTVAISNNTDPAEITDGHGSGWSEAVVGSVLLDR